MNRIRLAMAALVAAALCTSTLVAPVAHADAPAITTFAVPDYPNAIAPTADGSAVYVATYHWNSETYAQTASVRKYTPTGALLAQHSFDEQQTELYLTPDGALWAFEGRLAMVRKLDPDTLNVLASIHLGTASSAESLGTSPDGTHLYAYVYSDPQIDDVDLTTGTVGSLSVPARRNYEGVTGLGFVGTTIYASYGDFSATLVAYDTSNGTSSTRQISEDDDWNGARIVAVNANGVFVLQGTAVEQYSLTDLSRQATHTFADYPSAVAAAPNGSALHVLVSYTGTLTTLKSTDLSLASTTTVPDPATDVALSANGLHMIVDSGDNNSSNASAVSVFDAPRVAIGTAPSAPTGVTATTAGLAEQVIASFTTPASDGGLPITSYTATATDQTDVSASAVSVSGSAGPLTVTGLTGGHRYAVTVTATNDAGTSDASDPSDVVLALRAQPLALTANPSSTRVGTSFIPALTGGESGNAVRLSVGLQTTNGACTLSGSTVRLVHAGYCQLVARQAGNAEYAAATPIQVRLLVQRGTQAIRFTTTPPATSKVGDRYDIGVAGNGSPTPITVSLGARSSAGACTLSGTSVTVTGVGRCIVLANQSGTADYLPADRIQQALRIR